MYDEFNKPDLEVAVKEYSVLIYKRRKNDNH